MDLLLTILFASKLWRFLGWILSTAAVIAMGLGWRFGKVEARVARRFDIELSVINALPEWLRWMVPESVSGWAAAVLMLCIGLYFHWFARWVDRQTR